MIKAWGRKAAGNAFERLDYEPVALGPEEVEVAVEYCGVCHSDLSMVDNEWGMTAYPLIPGHEVVGRVVDLGANTKGLAIGQQVGIGWTEDSRSAEHTSEIQSIMRISHDVFGLK